jgi:hypothetical protein
MLCIKYDYVLIFIVPILYCKVQRDIDFYHVTRIRTIASGLAECRHPLAFYSCPLCLLSSVSISGGVHLYTGHCDELCTE